MDARLVRKGKQTSHLHTKWSHQPDQCFLVGRPPHGLCVKLNAEFALINVVVAAQRHPTT